MKLIDANRLIEKWDELSVRGRTEFDQVIMTMPTAFDVDELKMSEWKSIKEDGLPKVGDCLIVTVFDHCHNRRELRYPVYYLQHTYSDGYGFYFGDTSNPLIPEYSEVLAWQNVPNVYEGE